MKNRPWPGSHVGRFNIEGNITMIRYAIAAIFAMAALTGLTVDTWSNVAAMGGALDVRIYVATIAILGAVAGFFIPVAFKYNKLAGAVLFAGWALGVVFSIGASIDRVGGAKDAKVHAGASVNARIARLDQRIRDLTAKRNEEAGKGGCGRICRQWQQKLDAAVSQRNGFGEVKETDPGSARIEAITAGMVKADRWRTLHPIFGVLALTCMFNAMSIVAGSIAVSARPGTESYQR